MGPPSSSSNSNNDVDNYKKDPSSSCNGTL
jgi:hypothetical protein